MVLRTTGQLAGNEAARYAGLPEPTQVPLGLEADEPHIAMGKQLARTVKGMV